MILFASSSAQSTQQKTLAKVREALNSAYWQLSFETEAWGKVREALRLLHDMMEGA